MKTLKYTNADKSFDVEYLTDLIGSNEMMTNYQIKQVVNGVEQKGLNGDAIVFGMPDQIDQIVSDDNSREKFTLNYFKTQATDKNLTLEVYEDGEDKVTLNTLTALNITTTAMDGAVAGLAQVETITPANGAGTTQADYIVLTNALSQETAAVWLDVDAAGTAPTGAKYVAADFQIEVDVVTGDTAAQIATKIKDAIELVTGWADEVTIVDNTGTITITQIYNGLVAVADPENADDSGVGSIGAAPDTTGTAGTPYSDTVEAVGGNTVYVFTTEDTLPIGITLSTAGVLSGTAREVGTFDFDAKVTDRFGIEDTQAVTFEVTAS